MMGVYNDKMLALRKAQPQGGEIAGRSKAVQQKDASPEFLSRIESSVAYGESTPTGVSDLEGEAYPQSEVSPKAKAVIKAPPSPTKTQKPPGPDDEVTKAEKKADPHKWPDWRKKMEGVSIPPVPPTDDTGDFDDTGGFDDTGDFEDTGGVEDTGETEVPPLAKALVDDFNKYQEDHIYPATDGPETASDKANADLNYRLNYPEEAGTVSSSEHPNWRGTGWTMHELKGSDGIDRLLLENPSTGETFNLTGHPKGKRE